MVTLADRRAETPTPEEITWMSDVSHTENATNQLCGLSLNWIIERSQDLLQEPMSPLHQQSFLCLCTKGDIENVSTLHDV